MKPDIVCWQPVFSLRAEWGRRDVLVRAAPMSRIPVKKCRQDHTSRESSLMGTNYPTSKSSIKPYTISDGCNPDYYNKPIMPKTFAFVMTSLSSFFSLVYIISIIIIITTTITLGSLCFKTPAPHNPVTRATLHLSRNNVALQVEMVCCANYHLLSQQIFMLQKEKATSTFLQQ